MSNSKNRKSKRQDKKLINEEKKNSTDTNLNQQENNFFSSFEVVIIIIISLVFGIVLGSIITINNSSTRGNGQFNEFVTTYNSIINNYYKKVDQKKLLNAAIEGMVNYLDDPYSIYMTESEAQSFKETIDGSYEGIGATITITKDGVKVVDVFKDSPADKAGLKIGDLITKVNGKNTADQKLDDVVEMIKSKDISKVVIKRNNDTKTVSIKMGQVEVPSVSSDIIKKGNQKIGVINVSIFAANTYKQFSDNLNDLEKKNIDSLIIDVRDNAGGHLDQVSKVLSLFMKKDKVIYQIESKGKKKKYYASGKKDKKYKVVVLINGSSASASEILAAAMKESYGATLVGVKSYGKGTVQKEYFLSSGASFKYTVESWLTPKGNSINGKGITPDIVEELNDSYYESPSHESDNQLQRALQELTKTANN